MPSEPPAYGFDLDAVDHALLRSRPPERALAWVRSVVGPASRIVSCRALPGGTSSAIHGITIDTPRDRQRVVLRRYVRADWLRDEPDLAEHEARVLTLLEPSRVPAPHLVGVDATGEICDVPALLMTRLPGRVDWSPLDLDAYLTRLVEPLLTIATVDVPAGLAIRAYRPYGYDRPLVPPPATTCVEAWRRAIEIHHGPAPAGPTGFIHRDYHPGNVLWSNRAATAVVDWVNASIGSPDADVGHCRLNLALRFGPDAARRFTARYLERTGRAAYDPYYDLVAAVGCLPDAIARSLDDFVARAVAERN